MVLKLLEKRYEVEVLVVSVNIKKIIIIFLLVNLIFLIGGCWDREEPENYAIVIGIGFDYNEDREMYRVIIQIASPLIAHGIEGEGPEGKPSYWTVSAWGHTTIDALSNLRKKVTRQIHYSHTSVFIISEDFVKGKGVIPVIDALERTRQSRPIILMAVTRDNVKEVLEVNFPIETHNIKGIRQMINLSDEEIGTTVAKTAKNFINKLTRPGLEPVAVKLELLDGEDKGIEDNSENTCSEPDSPPELKIDGIATFRRDKLAGFLDGRETRGWNWTQGNIERAILHLKTPDIEENLSVVTRENESKIEPVLNDGKPEINIFIETTADIQGVMGRSQFEKKSDLVISLKKRLSQVIRNDIEMALTAGQEQKSDIFGFGNAFYRLHYDKWQEIKNDWEDIFTTLPVNIEIEVEVERTGMIDRGIEPR